jgi:hypothetical protein
MSSNQFETAESLAAWMKENQPSDEERLKKYDEFHSYRKRMDCAGCGENLYDVGIDRTDFVKEFRKLTFVKNTWKALGDDGEDNLEPHMEGIAFSCRACGSYLTLGQTLRVSPNFPVNLNHTLLGCSPFGDNV